MITLPDGFEISEDDAKHPLMVWTAHYSTGSNLPLSGAALMAGLVVLTSLGIKTNYPPGWWATSSEGHGRFIWGAVAVFAPDGVLQVTAYTGEHAAYLFDRVLPGVR